MLGESAIQDQLDIVKYLTSDTIIKLYPETHMKEYQIWYEGNVLDNVYVGAGEMIDNNNLPGTMYMMSDFCIFRLCTHCERFLEYADLWIYKSKDYNQNIIDYINGIKYKFSNHIVHI
jgi:hypothetical protein